MPMQPKKKASDGGASKALNANSLFGPDGSSKDSVAEVAPNAPAQIKLLTLQDRRHELLAQVAGVEIELAMLQGDRPAACEAQIKMFAEVAARRALRGLGPIGGPA